jgi:hypothetical protein
MHCSLWPDGHFPLRHMYCAHYYSLRSAYGISCLTHIARPRTTFHISILLSLSHIDFLSFIRLSSCVYCLTSFFLFLSHTVKYPCVYISQAISLSSILNCAQCVQRDTIRSFSHLHAFFLLILLHYSVRFHVSIFVRCFQSHNVLLHLLPPLSGGESPWLRYRQPA